MLKSMTGFGKATLEVKGLSVTVEIKSLNSKFTDIYCRLPRNLSSKEIEIRNLLTQTLERGKIELNLNTQRTGDVSANSLINRSLVKAYFQDLQQTSIDLFGGTDNTELLKLALAMPNAYNIEATPDDEAEAEWQTVLQTIQNALKECNAFRLREGEIVSAKFKEYIGNIETTLKAIEEQDKARIPAVRERLKKSVSDLLTDENFDKNRFEQELIYYIEKYDISEEKVRLRTHLNYFIEVLKEGNGKKLNFLSQEIGREINTIGSKANDASIQRLVVNMKEELEKIKEQTANVL
ncbi:TIGR00255 family protein [Pseudarcicella hirudinis]|uniref:TIGR00255 family protein n=1 Tax=Pseudarcicella hirudinis TaxID=1079859 RepID=A0A1I5PBC2_9BACT|nr:YicC/YloC family endoribonuclease [Pseudarcicella hirudinis]SFP31424.1 TIGR00255 family protein [Pseudarcicella hirudinis]